MEAVILFLAFAMLVFGVVYTAVGLYLDMRDNWRKD